QRPTTAVPPISRCCRATPSWPSRPVERGSWQPRHARSRRLDSASTPPQGGRRTLGYHRPMATLSRADVEHVAYLARLGLTEEELARLEGQLNHILDQYAILATVPTDHIAPTAQTIELENILRDDVARPSMPVEAVLANAPEHDDAFIVVPAILGERD